jgi:hypothetical protein
MTPCELAASCIPGIVAGIISGLFGSGWLGPRHQAWLKQRMDAENARAAFRNFLSPIINKIETTDANLMAILSWPPIFRPQVSFDFGRFAVDKKEQTYESKTETTQCGLQGQSGIRSPGGAENGRAIGARVCGASGAGHAVAGDDSRSHARIV